MLALTTLISLLSASTAVLGAPSPAAVSSDLPKFSMPDTSFGQVNAPAPASFGPLNDAARINIAQQYIAKKFSADFDVTSSHTTSHNGLTHVYLRQHHNGLPVMNVVSNVAVSNEGSVFTAGHPAEKMSFSSTVDVPKVSKIDAVIAASRALGLDTKNLKKSLKIVDNMITGAPFALSAIPVELGYFVKKDSTLELIYSLSIEEANRWMHFFVSAQTAEILGTTNWVAYGGGGGGGDGGDTPGNTPATGDFSYRVVDFVKDNILDDGSTLVNDPADKTASPNGWHNGRFSDGQVDTRGNNVAASVDSGYVSTTSKFARSKDGGKFDYTYDLTKDPEASTDAATTNVFYLANRYHDILYHYGFTEAAGNFQNDNFGKGGKGNDAIKASVQNPRGTNNANFATPPDGQPGRMNMYIFTQSSPKRDGDMENAVVLHEMTHGLSNRLTGGSATGDCLNSDESGGMGEGWSDTMAWAFSMKASDTRETDRTTGEWVMNNKAGIRRFPYSTNMKTNPHKYSDLSKDFEVHNIGETWSTMLYEVYWNMVEMSGFSPELLVDTKTSGNQRFIQLVVDGLKLQPCDPSFVQARDAILAADKADYNSKYSCAIWKAFAKRGLGVNASNHKDSFDTPKEC